MRRTALLAATLLLAGCITPSGIIDVTLPPQAEPINTPQVDLGCPNAVDPDAGDCIAEAIAASLTPKTERFRDKPNPRRWSPPPVMRR